MLEWDPFHIWSSRSVALSDPSCLCFMWFDDSVCSLAIKIVREHEHTLTTSRIQRHSDSATVTLVADLVAGQITNEKNHGSPNLDRDGVLRNNGNPQYGEAWKERTLLGYMSCTTKESKTAKVAKLKNDLRDCAWTLTHKNRNLTVARLMEPIATDDVGPEKAAREVLWVVRKWCEVSPRSKSTRSSWSICPR